MTDAPAPWERQPGETDRQFYAFTVYRDAPLSGQRRTLAGVKRVLERTSEWRINRWSVVNQWVPRALAWDDEQDRIWRASVLREKHRIAQQQARMAVQVKAKFVEGLLALNVADMGARDVVALGRLAQDLDRSVYGRLNDEADSAPGAGTPIVVIDGSLMPDSADDPLLSIEGPDEDEGGGLRAVR